MVESVIAIKDFEMPNGCERCPFVSFRVLEYSSDCNHWCDAGEFCLGSGSDIDDSRSPSCPLVEIPDHVG